MSTVTLETAQNVTIEYRIASVGDRILATIIDGLVIIGIVILMLLLGPATGLLDGLGTFGVLLFIVPVLLYHPLCEIFLDGQTMGKKAMKTKVVKLDGSQPNIGAYLLRWLLRLVEIDIVYGGVALITIIVNGKGQRLGDIAAGTCVVKLERPVQLGETIYKALEQDYQIKYESVSRLDDDDVDIARSVIRAMNTSRRNPKIDRLAETAASNLAQKMGVSFDETPRQFLRRVIRDYNHSVGRLE